MRKILSKALYDQFHPAPAPPPGTSDRQFGALPPGTADRPPDTLPPDSPKTISTLSRQVEMPNWRSAVPGG